MSRYHVTSEQADRNAWMLYGVFLFLACFAAGAWLDHEPDKAAAAEQPPAEVSAYAEGLVDGRRAAEAELDRVSQGAFQLGVEHGRQMACSSPTPAAAPVLTAATGSRR